MERKRDIGILKIQGAPPKWILSNFLFESLFVCIIACIFGILLGIFLIAPIWNYFASNASGFDLPFTLKNEVIILAVSVAIITGFGSIIFPGKNAAKTPPIEGLRYE